jgi:integrase
LRTAQKCGKKCGIDFNRGAQMAILSDRTVKTLGTGRHDAGEGLRLIVGKSGKRSWVFRYQLSGKRRDMGLGSYPEISLAEARKLTAKARELTAMGLDPLDARQAERAAKKPVPTFGEIAALVVADMQRDSQNEKVRYQAARHLGPVFCGPFLGRRVDEITTTEVAALLRPVWGAKPEVARKLHPAIRRVFNRARVVLKADHGILMFDNPASWENLKAQGFKAPQALSRGPHPSLSYSRISEFMCALQHRDALAARMLEFMILTNVRTESVLGAKWSEFNLNEAIWVVPIDRLKDGKHRTEPFRVPLSRRALEILHCLSTVRQSEFVFTSTRGAFPMSNMAMLTLIHRMNAADGDIWHDANDRARPIVPHGFRSTFRTWAEETSRYAHAIIEEAMGHIVGTKVERAYRRTDILELRRVLMEAWANHCEPMAPSNVVTLSRPGAHGR